MPRNITASHSTGDVNGDGFADLIVGAPRADNNGSLSGSARVFSGSDGSVLYNFDGASIGRELGTWVSSAGDVNADGMDDFIVGSTRSASVFSGSDGSVVHEFTGSLSNRFGQSVSGAGDVNGDGTPDLIVGSPRDDGNDLTRGGSARVLSGIDGSILYNFEGDTERGQFGHSVNSAGDVNGDGMADLIVGAPFSALIGLTSTGPGYARVLSGSDGSVLYNFDGDSAGDFFGGSVSGAGDVNGDGTPDLIVGAGGVDNNGSSSGSARVLSGNDGSVLYTFDGGNELDQFGGSISGVGDVNGDQTPDLIVGVAGDDNNGISSGSACVLSGSDGSILYTFNGDSPSDRFGQSVSGAGDVNGDGIDDFIVGANAGGYARVFVSQISPNCLLGDVDVDGSVDFFDIAPLIAVLASGEYQCEADCDQSGEVGFDDIAPFLTILSRP